MFIFYGLHELMPFDTDDGKRNTKVFVIGIIIYSLIFILFANMMLYKYFDPLMYDAYYYVGLLLFMSDICVMGYIYKSYYGRSIINELNENNDGYKWKEKKHRYIKK